MTNGTRTRTPRRARHPAGCALATALCLGAATADAAEGAAPGRPLPITIRAPEPPAPKTRLEQLLAKRDAAARRWQIGICRGCSRGEGVDPAGRMIEVSTERPRASWEITAPP